METPGNQAGGARPAAKSPARGAHTDLPLEHYLRMILHRKWWVIGVFLPVSLATILICQSLPNIYTSDTLILVDPQTVPQNYVKPTVTGDVRDRLSTLSQQILSATRLQKIIDTFNLYPEERKKMAREDVILLMRSHISVKVVSDFGSADDLQAFRITYSGEDPRLVAQVTNELASLFIEENLKAREQQAQGTTDFLANQLEETRRTLEEQEAQLRDFKLSHIGEMPEQQGADLQILAQVQSQLQLENDALSRDEQQRTYIQSMFAASAPVIDTDNVSSDVPATPNEQTVQSKLPAMKAKLAQLLTHYSKDFPDVKKLSTEVKEEEQREATAAAAAKPKDDIKKRVTPRQEPVVHFNPVLQSQLQLIDADIAKHKAEQERLAKEAADYQAKLAAIPVREQQIADLERDYQISKDHYKQLLQNQLNAETATQLEIRQKAEKFSVLDPAQPAERPSRPNRVLIDAVGSLAGLGLGLLLAISTELFSASITEPEQIVAASGLPVLEVIPIIQTSKANRAHKRLLILAAASGTAVLLTSLAVYYYRSHSF
jgi:succinoglycan biosynthesis transport protein ExoP